MADFYAYGLLDLVDKSLSSLHSKILKKKWDECVVTIEALTVFNDLESWWPSEFLYPCMPCILTTSIPSVR